MPACCIASYSSRVIDWMAAAQGLVGRLGGWVGLGCQKQTKVDPTRFKTDVVQLDAVEYAFDISWSAGFYCACSSHPTCSLAVGLLLLCCFSPFCRRLIHIPHASSNTSNTSSRC